jgi:hypothetical protein
MIYNETYTFVVKIMVKHAYDNNHEKRVIKIIAYRIKNFLS